MRRHTSWFLVVGLLCVTLLAGCDNNQYQAENRLQHIEDLILVGEFDTARRLVDDRLETLPDDVGARLMRARIDAEAGAYRQAIEAYEALLVLDPDWREAQVGLGRAMIASGRLDEARHQFETLATLSSGDSDMLLLKADIAAAENNAERARAFAEAAMAAYPEDPRPYATLARLQGQTPDRAAAFAVLEDGLARLRDEPVLWRAMVELAQDQQDSARLVQALKQLRRLVPDAAGPVLQLATVHYQQGDTRLAETLLRERLQQFPGETSTLELLARFHLQAQPERSARIDALSGLVEEFGQQPVLDLVAARLAIADGDAQTATALLKPLLESETDADIEIRVRKTLAGLALSTGDRDAAAAQIGRVLDMAPGDAEALVARAALAVDKGEPGAAIDDLEIVLAQDPASASGTRLLVEALVQHGDDQQTADYLERLMAQAPRHRDLYVALVDLYARQRRSDDVRRVLEQLLVVLPGDPYALRQLVDLALQNGDLVAALEHAEALKAAHPAHPDGDYAAGLVYEAGAAYLSAANAYLAALDKQPDAIEPLTALVRTRVAQGEIDRAIAELQQRLSRNPRHFVAMNLLGELHRRQGQDDEALQMFRQATAISPGWAVPYANAADVLVERGEYRAALAVLRNGYEPTANAPLLRQRATQIESRLQDAAKATAGEPVDG